MHVRRERFIGAVLHGWYLVGMALPTFDCSAPSGACCTAVFDIANRLLEQALDAVNGCIDDGCDRPLGYITFGDGDGQTDGLTVTVRDLGPHPGVRPGTIHPHRVNYAIRLLESGWPTAQVVGETIKFPEPAAQNFAAYHLLGRTEAMYRRVVHLVTQRDLGVSGIRVAKAYTGALTPIPPRGGVAGALMTVTVDLAQ